MNYPLNARRDALDDVGLFESVSNEERVHRFDKNLGEKLRRGDLIKYKGHISMVYSDRPSSCSTDKDGKTTCTYEIIHAYGGRRADLNNDQIADEFARKVIISPNRLLLPDGTYSLSNPTGFGRIKLWD